MRILGVTNLYPNPLQPHRGAFNRQQFEALARRHTVSVIAPISWTDERAARRAGTGASMPAGRRVDRGGVTVHHPRYWFTPKVLRPWYGHFFRASVRPTFRRAVAEFRPELIYATWAFPDGWAAAELAEEAGLPLVIKVHGSDVLQLLTSAGRRRRTADALKCAGAVVAVSRDLADKVVGLGVDPGRVRVVYNGVNADVFRRGSEGDARARLGIAGADPLVLFVGNLVQVKGLDTLTRAFASMAAAGVRFTGALIGQGPLKAQLEKDIESAGLGSRVKLLGPKSLEELPDWYRAAAVCVLPSYSEGVPNVLLEAAACGAPFVASRVGGVPEIAHLTRSRLVPPGDADALAAALREAVEGRFDGFSEGASSPRIHDDAAAELTELFERVAREHAGRAEKSDSAVESASLGKVSGGALRWS